MTGQASISASLRLKRNKNVTEEDSEDSESYVEDWRRRMFKLLSVVDTESFGNIRINDDKDLFQTFVEFCLIHFATCSSWKWKAYNNVLSNIFTASDEALAMLLLENNINDLKKTHETKEKLQRYQSRPKYTKVEQSSSERFRGWHKKGIKRYNELYRCIVENRETDYSKNHEEDMQIEFAEICGKNGNNLNEVEDEYSDDDSCEGIEAIDGFVGDRNTSREMPNLEGTGEIGEPITTILESVIV